MPLGQSVALVGVRVHEKWPALIIPGLRVSTEVYDFTIVAARCVVTCRRQGVTTGTDVKRRTRSVDLVLGAGHLPPYFVAHIA